MGFCLYESMLIRSPREHGARYIDAMVGWLYFEEIVHIDQDISVWHPFVSGAGAKGENALGSGGFRIVFVDDNVVVEIIDAYLEIVFKDEFSQRIMRELDIGFLYRGHVHMTEPADLGAFSERGADRIKEFDGIQSIVGFVLYIENIMCKPVGFY